LDLQQTIEHSAVRAEDPVPDPLVSRIEPTSAKPPFHTPGAIQMKIDSHRQRRSLNIKAGARRHSPQLVHRGGAHISESHNLIGPDAEFSKGIVVKQCDFPEPCLANRFARLVIATGLEGRLARRNVEVPAGA
jgi:hypothetical protein